jgi:hypothetical protein
VSSVRGSSSARCPQGPAPVAGSSTRTQVREERQRRLLTFFCFQAAKKRFLRVTHYKKFTLPVYHSDLQKFLQPIQQNFLFL